MSSWICWFTISWTVDDLSVVCRKLGFGSGSIYRWFEKYNHTEQLSLQSPRCTGQEGRLESCKGWDSRLVGSGICGKGYKCFICLCLFCLGCKPFWNSFVTINDLMKEKHLNHVQIQNTIRDHVPGRVRLIVSRKMTFWAKLGFDTILFFYLNTSITVHILWYRVSPRCWSAVLGEAWSRHGNLLEGTDIRQRSGVSEKEIPKSGR